MANTAPYRCPPAHQFPPAHECTAEDFQDIAARAADGALHELMSSSPHVLGICHVLEQQQTQLLAALATADQLRREAVRLSAENAQLRIQAGLNTLAITITGRSAADLSAEHAAWDRRERAAQRRLADECSAISSLSERQRCDTVEIVELHMERASVRVFRTADVHARFADVLDETCVVDVIS